jgi:uncharacterized glyoxalase superfamily protein PhnB
MPDGKIGHAELGHGASVVMLASEYEGMNLAEPEDQFYGARIYRAVDPEGHRWIFATQVRDVPADAAGSPA